MKYDDFIDCLNDGKPPINLKLILLALWFDKKGDWDKAHRLVQNETGKDYALIHAYLLRKEGDLWNSNYWYEKSGDKMPGYSLSEEWQILAKRFTN